MAGLAGRKGRRSAQRSKPGTIIIALEFQEAYSKLPIKMIKQVCDLRRRAEGSAAAEGFE